MKKQTGFTLIELLIVVAIVCILVAIVVGLVGQPSRDERCAEICDGLRQKKVKVTPDVCICEDPESKTRQAYPLGTNTQGNYPASYQQGVWEADD